MENKRWLKRKGCKNVALVDIVRHHEDGSSYTETVVTPYYIGKPVTYVTKRLPCNQLGAKTLS